MNRKTSQNLAEIANDLGENYSDHHQQNTEL